MQMVQRTKETCQKFGKNEKREFLKKKSALRKESLDALFSLHPYGKTKIMKMKRKNKKIFINKKDLTAVGTKGNITFEDM